jgi:hypothetical protein
MNSAASSPRAADSAGAIAPLSAPAHLSWIERRDAARAFLAARGNVPYLLNRTAAYAASNSWHVPGWSGVFDDSDLIALAEHLGWEGANG